MPRFSERDDEILRKAFIEQGAKTIYDNQLQTGWRLWLHHVRKFCPFPRWVFAFQTEDVQTNVSLSYRDMYMAGESILSDNNRAMVKIYSHFLFRQRRRDKLKEKFLDPKYLYPYGLILILLLLLAFDVIDVEFIKAIKG